MRFSLNDVAAEFRRFEARKSSLFKPLRTVVTDVAKAAKAETKATIRRRKGGKSYSGQIDRKAYKLEKRGRGRAAVQVSLSHRGYVASAPGEAPASRTGVLLASIRQARLRKKGADFGFFIFANSKTAFYRHFLEFGTRERARKRRGGGSSGKIAPRPLFTPLALKYERLLRERIEREIPAALRELIA